MRRKRAVLGTVLGQLGRGALHVAALAGGEVRRIKRKGIAVREFGLLPFVVSREGPNEFVVVQLRRQVGLVTSGAKFRRMHKVMHHRLRMALRGAKNHIEGYFAWNTLPLLVDDHRGHAHLQTCITAGRIQLKYRVAGGASESVGIEISAIDLRVLRERRAKHPDWVVATIAVAGKGDAPGLVAN